MVNRIEPTRKGTEKPESFNPWISQFFSHQCYITFLTGCYSCHWKYGQWETTKLGSCCCTQSEQLFCPFLIMSFVLSVILLFLWIETSNEYFGIDWVAFLGTGYWFFWSIFLLSLCGILAAYTSLLLLLGILLIWERIKLYLHWCHKALILLVMGLCIFFTYVVCKYWNDRWLVAGLSLQIFAPYMHLSSISMMVILCWPVAFCVARLEREALQVAVGVPFILILLFLYSMPLGIYSPCIQEKENLGPKPTFIAHRGAPMAGPENTIMAFEKAVEEGAYALETDIYLSYDEVPFLMHDYDLRRTTNIREVLPEAALNYTASFRWDFLSTLNAGKWFLQTGRRPFFNMKPLSEADKEKARNQSIPKLGDLLKIAKKEKKFVIFDLNAPPPKHPVRHKYIHQVVSVILDSQIEQHLILWLPGHDREYVRKAAPGFQHVGRLWSIERLTEENISRINVDYKRLFHNGLKDYKAANIDINLYIINEPWLFSLAWCSRINSVTTDNIPLLSQLNHPHFFMTPSFYIFIWVLMDIVSAVFIVALFCFHWWREIKTEKSLTASRIPEDIQETALMTEKESRKIFGLQPPSSQPGPEERLDTQTPFISQQHPKRQPSKSSKEDTKPPVPPMGDVDVKPPVSPKETNVLPGLAEKNIAPPASHPGHH